jgi:hypothetical protein
MGALILINDGWAAPKTFRRSRGDSKTDIGAADAKRMG